MRPSRRPRQLGDAGPPVAVTAFIEKVENESLENIDRALEGFKWEFERGDCHHWMPLFKRFETFFDTYVKHGSHILLEGSSPQPEECIPVHINESELTNKTNKILQVTMNILENCSSTYMYPSTETLAILLSSSNPDVVFTALETLMALGKRGSSGSLKRVERSPLLLSRLRALCQENWSSTSGLDLVSLASTPESSEMFYAISKRDVEVEFFLEDEKDASGGTMKKISQSMDSIMKLGTNETSSCLQFCENNGIPLDMRFGVLAKMRVLNRIGSYNGRLELVKIRLLAFTTFILSNPDHEALSSFFSGDPEFISDLIRLICMEMSVSEDIRTLALRSLAAASYDRSRSGSVLHHMTTGANRGLLSALMQGTVSSLTSRKNDTAAASASKSYLKYAEAMMSLLTALTTSSSGCSALSEAGLIATLLPLLSDMNPDHIGITTSAIRILEVFMDFSQPAAMLFRELGGLDALVERLEVEVGSSSSDPYTGCETDKSNAQSACDKDKVSSYGKEAQNASSSSSSPSMPYSQRFLLKSILRAVAIASVPLSANTVTNNAESGGKLRHCLKIIFGGVGIFGPAAFSLAASVMSELIHHDPTCFRTLNEAGLPEAFLQAVEKDLHPSSEVISCVPHTIIALSLNTTGLALIIKKDSLKFLVKVFTDKEYIRALTSDTPQMLGSSMDELVRHVPRLRELAIDKFINILKRIVKMSGNSENDDGAPGLTTANYATEAMDTDTEKKAETETETETEPTRDSEDFLDSDLDDYTITQYIHNFMRFLEPLMTNGDTSKAFLDLGGAQLLLKIYTVPRLPPNFATSLAANHLLTIFRTFVASQGSAPSAMAVRATIRKQIDVAKACIEKGLLRKDNGRTILKITFDFTKVDQDENLKNLLGCLNSLESLIIVATTLLRKNAVSVLTSSAFTGSQAERENLETIDELGGLNCDIMWVISFLSEKERILNDKQTEPFTEAASNDALGLEKEHLQNFSGKNKCAPDLNPSLSEEEECSHNLTKEALTKLKEALNKLKNFSAATRGFYCGVAKTLISTARRGRDELVPSPAMYENARCIASVFHNMLETAKDGLDFSSGRDTKLNKSENCDENLSSRAVCRFAARTIEESAVLLFDGRRRTCNTLILNAFNSGGTIASLIDIFEKCMEVYQKPIDVSKCSIEKKDASELFKKDEFDELLETSAAVITSICNPEHILGSLSSLIFLIVPLDGSEDGATTMSKQYSESTIESAENVVKQIHKRTMDALVPTIKAVSDREDHMLRIKRSSMIQFVFEMIAFVLFGTEAAGNALRQRALGVRTVEANSRRGNVETTPTFTPDDTVVSLMVEMGFPRNHAHEALRRVGTNNAAIATDWLLSHPAELAALPELPAAQDDVDAENNDNHNNAADAPPTNDASGSARSDADTTQNENQQEKMELVTEVKTSADELANKKVWEEYESILDLDTILDLSLSTLNGTIDCAHILADILTAMCFKNNIWLASQVEIVMQTIIKRFKAVLHAHDDDAILIIHKKEDFTLLSHLLAVLLSEEGLLKCRKIASEEGLLSTILEALKLWLASASKYQQTFLQVPHWVLASFFIIDFLSIWIPSEKKESEEDENVNVTSLLGKEFGYLASDKELTLMDVCIHFVVGMETARGKDNSCDDGELFADSSILCHTILQIIARLTRRHSNASHFVSSDGERTLNFLLKMVPPFCFSGYEAIVSTILRHILEDPASLQNVMEIEIKNLIASSPAQKILAKHFLSFLAPVMAREPTVFMRAVKMTCMKTSVEGKHFISLNAQSKIPEGLNANGTPSSNATSSHPSTVQVKGSEIVKTKSSPLDVSDSRLASQQQDIHKARKNANRKAPATFQFVVDNLLSVVQGFNAIDDREESEFNSLETDTMTGKQKSDMEFKMYLEATHTGFALRMMTEATMMYAAFAGVVMKKDILEDQTSSQARAGKFLKFVIHSLLTLSQKQKSKSNKTCYSKELQSSLEKIYERSMVLLVALSLRSGDGKRRIIEELSRTLSAFQVGTNPALMKPFIMLINSLLVSSQQVSHRVPANNFLHTGDIAKHMVMTDMISQLTRTLQNIESSHPEASKVIVNILKCLEILTRKANKTSTIKSTVEKDGAETTDMGEAADGPTRDSGRLANVSAEGGGNESADNGPTDPQQLTQRQQLTQIARNIQSVSEQIQAEREQRCAERAAAELEEENNLGDVEEMMAEMWDVAQNLSVIEARLDHHLDDNEENDNNENGAADVDEEDDDVIDDDENESSMSESEDDDNEDELLEISDSEDEELPFEEEDRVEEEHMDGNDDDDDDEEDDDDDNVNVDDEDVEDVEEDEDEGDDDDEDDDDEEDDEEDDDDEEDEDEDDEDGEDDEYVRPNRIFQNFSVSNMAGADGQRQNGEDYRNLQLRWRDGLQGGALWRGGHPRNSRSTGIFDDDRSGSLRVRIGPRIIWGRFGEGRQSGSNRSQPEIRSLRERLIPRNSGMLMTSADGQASNASQGQAWGNMSSSWRNAVTTGLGLHTGSQAETQNEGVLRDTAEGITRAFSGIMNHLGIGNPRDGRDNVSDSGQARSELRAIFGTSPTPRRFVNPLDNHTWEAHVLGAGDTDDGALYVVEDEMGPLLLERHTNGRRGGNTNIAMETLLDFSFDPAMLGQTDSRHQNRLTSQFVEESDRRPTEEAQAERQNIVDGVQNILLQQLEGQDDANTNQHLEQLVVSGGGNEEGLVVHQEAHLQSAQEEFPQAIPQSVPQSAMETALQNTPQSVSLTASPQPRSGGDNQGIQPEDQVVTASPDLQNEVENPNVIDQEEPEAAPANGDNTNIPPNDVNMENVSPSDQENERQDTDGAEMSPGDENGATNEVPAQQTGLAAAAAVAGIDPAFLEALPPELRAEVLVTQVAPLARRNSAQENTTTEANNDVRLNPENGHPQPNADLDPEFLAALPPDIQQEVVEQQRLASVLQRNSEGGLLGADMDSASIIATLDPSLRAEVLLTTDEDLLSQLPPALMAEAQILREQARRERDIGMLRGHGIQTSSRPRVGREIINRERREYGHTYPVRARFPRNQSSRGFRESPREGPTNIADDSPNEDDGVGNGLFKTESIKTLIDLLRMDHGKGFLKRLLHNLCMNKTASKEIVELLVEVLAKKHEMNSTPTYRRVLEVFVYLVKHNPRLAHLVCEASEIKITPSISVCDISEKGKAKMTDSDTDTTTTVFQMLISLLDDTRFHQSSTLLESLINLIEMILCTAEMYYSARSKEREGDIKALADDSKEKSGIDEAVKDAEKQVETGVVLCPEVVPNDICNVMPSSLESITKILVRDGLSPSTYNSAICVMKKLANRGLPIRESLLEHLAKNAINMAEQSNVELQSLIPTDDASQRTKVIPWSLSRTVAGLALLRTIQAIKGLLETEENDENPDKEKVGASGSKSLQPKACDMLDMLAREFEPLWETLSIGAQYFNAGMPIAIPRSQQTYSQRRNGASPLPAATAKVLPLVETFFVLSEARIGASKEKTTKSPPLSRQSIGRGGLEIENKESFVNFAERHRQLLNSIIRQDPRLLDGSLRLLLRCTRLVDFDNKRAVYRNRIRKQADERHYPNQRICVRREFVLDDSYHQLRMRSPEELRGRLTITFQGEEGVDAGGLTREWYHVLAREIFDQNKALLISADGGLTYQPNPNSGVNPEHLSYFKFIGRIVAKALYDGQLLDAHFTRSFYKHILGVPITYEDIEAIDPDYFKNLTFILEHDLATIGMDHLTFSVDADQQQRELFGNTKDQIIDLIPSGRETEVTEERKREYVNLVAEHRMTTSIKPQISAFLEGFDELIARDMINIFNEKELELLISGLPEIDLDDLRANTEYVGFTSSSPSIQWFWEIVNEMSKEDVARLLMFCTGTTKVPLDGFRALQGISGPQCFQIHKAYGDADRLPTGHTCFNQLDLIEYPDKETLKSRLYMAVLEGSEGFAFH